MLMQLQFATYAKINKYTSQMIIDLMRKGGLWANHMGLKQGAIGNIFGEHIGNLIETH